MVTRTESSTPTSHELDKLLPAQFGDGRVAAAVFSIPFECARQAVGPPQLHPVEIPGRRALAVLCTFEYLQSALGAYREFVVGVVVRTGAQSGPFRRSISLSAAGHRCVDAGHARDH